MDGRYGAARRAVGVRAAVPTTLTETAARAAAPVESIDRRRRTKCASMHSLPPPSCERSALSVDFAFHPCILWLSLPSVSPFG